MSSVLTINITNQTPTTQSIFVFQQPAVITGGAQVYSNSLFCLPLGSYEATGAVLTFQTSTQPIACIQQASGPPTVGMMSGYSAAIRPIDLASSAPSNDTTTASINPLGLSQPVDSAGVQQGSFRLITPAYQPTQTYNIGSAVQTNGSPVLSSFVLAMPNYIVDCQPILKFYVQTGSYTPGTVMNFSQASIDAAVCDFTGGYTTVNVTLNADGTWTVMVVR